MAPHQPRYVVHGLLIGLLLVMQLMMLPSNAIMAHSPRTLKVVATFSILANIAQQVAGDTTQVSSLVPVNGDTHDYEPTTGDIRKVADADLLLINGLGLEVFLKTLIENTATQATIITVSDGIDVLSLADDYHHAPIVLGQGGQINCASHEHAPEETPAAHEPNATAHEDDHAEHFCDPHAWHNPQNVIQYVRNITRAFSDADPQRASIYHANAAQYIATLNALDSDIKAAVAAIPLEQRILVTNHDTLGYYAEHYHFKIISVLLRGGDANSEPTPKALAELIDTLNAAKVKVIFAENVASTKFADLIAGDVGGIVVQAVYTDALSEAGSDGDSYIKMLDYNTKVIVESLLNVHR